MFPTRFAKNLGAIAVLIILIAVMGFGCQLLPGDFHDSRPKEESRPDNGSEEMAEAGVPDVISPGDSPYPEYFDDPVINYLEMEKHNILSMYGNPEDTGYYGGGYYLSYKEKAGLIFFFPQQIYLFPTVFTHYWSIMII